MTSRIGFRAGETFSNNMLTRHPLFKVKRHPTRSSQIRSSATTYQPAKRFTHRVIVPHTFRIKQHLSPIPPSFISLLPTPPINSFVTSSRRRFPRFTVATRTVHVCSIFTTRYDHFLRAIPLHPRCTEFIRRAAQALVDSIRGGYTTSGARSFD